MKITIQDINKMDFDKRIDFLSSNKDEVLKMKRSIIKISDVFEMPKTANKAQIQPIVENEVDKLHVKVVANTALWIDSQLDMLLPDCWKRSIENRMDMIPHLHDHIRQIDAKVGEVKNIYGQYLTYSELGIQGIGQTQVLIFETEIMKEYNEMVFNQYKSGKINQHSISLQYVSLQIAINDKKQDKEYQLWNQYIPLAINKQVAIESGYFFIVKECKVIENSCVLFGANEITPTLQVIEITNSSEDLPQKAQVETILNIDPPKKALNYDYLLSKI